MESEGGKIKMKSEEVGRAVDKLFHKEGRRRGFGMKKRTAIGVFVVLGILLTITVSAALIPWHGEAQMTIKAKQGTTLDGHAWDDPVTHMWDEGAYGGCCECVEHYIEKPGCNGGWYDWEHWGEPDMEGIYITMVEKEPDCCEHILELLEVNVLDGQAQWDDFEVYVDGSLVYAYAAVGGAETWILHAIDLIPWRFQCCGIHTVEIVCTASQPWAYFNPYGQLGVDTITLYCEELVLCDSVDIGKPASEAGHNLQGWGPIEPATHGGTWGGIDDCRATWFWTPGDTMPASVWYTADASWASVELACLDCYETPECDCDQEPMGTPFYLGPGEMLDFCLCYELDDMIEELDYLVYSQLISVPAPL